MVNVNHNQQFIFMPFHLIHYQMMLKIFIRTGGGTMYPVCAVEICFNHASPQISRLISWPSGSQHRSTKVYFHADWRTFLCSRQILPGGRQKWTFFHHQRLIRSCHRFNKTKITTEKQGSWSLHLQYRQHTGDLAVVRAEPVWRFVLRVDSPKSWGYNIRWIFISATFCPQLLDLDQNYVQIGILTYIKE